MSGAVDLSAEAQRLAQRLRVSCIMSNTEAFVSVDERYEIARTLDALAARPAAPVAEGWRDMATTRMLEARRVCDETSKSGKPLSAQFAAGVAHGLSELLAAPVEPAPPPSPENVEVLYLGELPDDFLADLDAAVDSYAPPPSPARPDPAGEVAAAALTWALARGRFKNAPPGKDAKYAYRKLEEAEEAILAALAGSADHGR